MSLSLWAGNRLPKLALVLVPLLYGVFLAGQEWRFRQALDRNVPVIADSPVAPARDLPNVQAVATVLGLAPEGAQAPSAEPITLQASLLPTRDCPGPCWRTPPARVCTRSESACPVAACCAGSRPAM